MRALNTFAPEQAAKIRFLLTDIDDTLTTDGHLTAGAYAALERLSATISPGCGLFLPSWVKTGRFTCVTTTTDGAC